MAATTPVQFGKDLHNIIENFFDLDSFTVHQKQAVDGIINGKDVYFPH